MVAPLGSSLLVILIDPRGQGQMALVNGRRAVMELFHLVSSFACARRVNPRCNQSNLVIHWPPTTSSM